MMARSNDQTIGRWLERFPQLRAMEPTHLRLACDAVQFPVLEAGDVAYREQWDCPNYVMCIDGRTRVFKLSANAREILIYKVQGGGTCVLTTQCILSGQNFPAESVAEERTQLAAIPRGSFNYLMGCSTVFREFVLHDYSKLLSQLFSLVDEVAFASTGQRLARRIVAEADPEGRVLKTHQQLASDVGSVREVVSRYLSDWESAGWIATGRGEVRILDRSALVSVR